jgi:hypothetical protein
MDVGTRISTLQRSGKVVQGEDEEEEESATPQSSEVQTPPGRKEIQLATPSTPSYGVAPLSYAGTPSASRNVQTPSGTRVQERTRARHEAFRRELSGRIVQWWRHLGREMQNSAQSLANGTALLTEADQNLRSTAVMVLEASNAISHRLHSSPLYVQATRPAAIVV